MNLAELSAAPIPHHMFLIPGVLTKTKPYDRPGSLETPTWFTAEIGEESVSGHALCNQ